MRRELRFKNFEDVRAELAQLEKGPVETTGVWSYAQILDHCAASLVNSMKGLEREMSWWKKHVSGHFAARMTASRGYINPGIKGNPQTALAVRVEGDEKVAMANLRQALLDFEKFEGKLSLHPRLGKLNKKLWYHFHAMHIANHLGHAKPANK